MALTQLKNNMISGAQINIKDYESLSSGGTDWQPAIQAAIDSLDTGSDTTTGGVIYFPMGRYYIKSPIIVRTSGGANLSSVTFQGEGMHNTILDCAVDFSGTRAIHVLDSTYCVFKDFQVLCNTRANYGIEFENGSEIYVERVFCQNSSTSDFYVHRCFMMTMNQCRAKGGVTQFDFSGDYNTSLNIMNCYAQRSSSNPGIGQGFLVRDVSYSTFTACGADFTGRWGYRIGNTKAVSFNNCGSEQSVRAAFYFEASQALDDVHLMTGTEATLNQCFSTGADSDGGYGSIYSNQVDTSFIDVEVNRFNENNVDGSYSVANTGVDLDHKISLNNCKFVGSIISTAATINPVDVIRVNDLSVTTANTPVIDLSSVFGSSNNYSGLIHVVASNTSPSSGSPANTSAYILLITKSTGGSGIVEIASNGLIAGGSANHPSFTWVLDTTNNNLEATPVGSTSGNFYFYIGQIGALAPS